MDIRHDARHRHAAQLLERFEPRLQDLLISAEFVDDGAADARSLVRLEQGHGAVELCEHAAAVNVADEEHRRVHELRKAHVHDVLLLEIDLRRASRALDDEDIVLRGERVIRFHHRGDILALAAVILHRVHVALHDAVDDHLAANVGRRLEKNGVHAHVRRDARGLRLHDLRAPHLAARGGDEGVERHVLAFERRDSVAVLPENAAQSGAEDALARVGHRALDHNVLCHGQTSRRARMSASFSARVRTAMRYQLGQSPA